MTHENNDTANCGPRIREKAEELIYAYLNTASALFWRINIIKNKIRYLNSYRVPGLGSKTCHILKNMAYARNVILEKDFFRFEAFMKAVKSQKPASVLVRVKADDGTVRWLRVAGWPDPCKSSCCFGSISEETDLINGIRVASRDELSIRQKVNLFDNPVFLANFSDKKIMAANRAALSVFNYTEDEIHGLSLDDIFSGNGEPYLHAIYESLIFDQIWNGDIILQGQKGTPFAGQAAIRAVSDLGKNMLWISIRNLTEKESPRIEPFPGIKKASSADVRRVEKIGRTDDIGRLLPLLLDSQPEPGLADAVMYSDVDIRRNRVSVHGAGSGFENLVPGATHPYEGSIAENIRKFRLNHLILNETSESIKPIDWALFIPMGIRSYFAKPFYEEGVLNTVLVFCSSKSGTFNEENVKPYSTLFPAFLEGLARWKKRP